MPPSCEAVFPVLTLDELGCARGSFLECTTLSVSAIYAVLFDSLSFSIWERFSFHFS